MKTRVELGALLVWVLIVGLVAGFGGMFSPGEWYAGLQKPDFTPPNWVFGPAWTTLYTLMAVAAWLVWRARRITDVWPALAMFLVQLALNGAWSALFFGAQWPEAALVDLIALDLAVAVTVVLFWRVRRLAGVLLIPYLLWIGYATALNYGIWVLNR